MLTVGDVLSALDQEYSLARAASWDKVGLQIGDAAARVQRVLVAHEVTSEVLDAAADCQALVVYHPLIFRPLENLNFQNHIARLAARCLAQNLNLIVAHTSLDHAPLPRALGDRLAAELGLQEVAVLKPDGFQSLCKIVVFVPPEALEVVSDALWQAGAGQIGHYDRASFRARGVGTFRPLEGADPYSGEIGQLEEADEWRLEVIAPEAQREAIVRAMKAAHPYEEVAYDVVSLQNREAGQAFGAARVGVLDKSILLAEYARDVQLKLRVPSVRIVSSKTEIRKIACVPGSGASYLSAAARAGCDCLVTGDIKHHDALQAQALGLSILDVTHVATERAAVSMLAEALSTLDLEIRRAEIETNPFTAM